jgi:5'-nucleotidase
VGGTSATQDVSPDDLSTLAARDVPGDAPGAGRDGQGERPRCLVTNDDGIGSEGIRLLALAAVEAGFDVTVAAPLRDVSGASASITAVEADGRFVVEPRQLLGLESVPAYGVQALPAFIALVGARGAFGPPPDIVLSGINHGPNTGYAILHSGTVGAALTASTHGCRAMAISLAVSFAGEAPHWDTAAAMAARVLPLILDAPAGAVLNVNVPNVPAGAVRGLQRAGLARFGAVQFNVAEKGEGYVKISLSEIEAEYEPESDAALLADGYATITALRPVCQADGAQLELTSGVQGTPPGPRASFRPRRRSVPAL